MTLASLLPRCAAGLALAACLLLPSARARAQDPLPPVAAPTSPAPPAPWPGLPALPAAAPAAAAAASDDCARRLMYVGAGILAGGYAATVTHNLLDPKLHARVFLPLVGPWLVIGQAGTRGDGPSTPLLALEGLVQAAGLITLLAGVDASVDDDGDSAAAALGLGVLPGGGLATLAGRF